MSEALNSLLQELYDAKATEDAAKARRMLLEEAVAKELEVPEQWEGSRTREIGAFKVSVKRAMNVKIDSARLKEIICSHELEEAADAAFRWKAELNKKGWDALDEDARTYFSEAITKTPGKIGVSVAMIEKD